MEAPRIGIGSDLHRMVLGRPCVLGGERFDCEVGPEGHSDADAVLHALCDALLGAAGLDDLGTLFPDSEPGNRDRSSTEFLAEVCARVRAAGLAPASVDLVVHCDRPRIGPRRAAIRARLAALLDLPVDRVNLKGKSLEGTGGEDEAVSVLAVALLVQAPGA
ncbi:MAG: 2-C-methyl-D-erythritol 2,4-cyclodiphosphate synthase [Planctomycetota bacterium]